MEVEPHDDSAAESSSWLYGVLSVFPLFFFPFLLGLVGFTLLGYSVVC